MPNLSLNTGTIKSPRKQKTQVLEQNSLVEKVKSMMFISIINAGKSNKKLSQCLLKFLE